MMINPLMSLFLPSFNNLPEEEIEKFLDECEVYIKYIREGKNEL